MSTVICLHGFGLANPMKCQIRRALAKFHPNLVVQSPGYHPGGIVSRTNLSGSLAEVRQMVEQADEGPVHLVGYSYGGWMAALIAAEIPDRIGNVLLLAPAIDNYQRNYQRKDPSEWSMPQSYVEDIQQHAGRPELKRPTVIVHGLLDADRGGAHPSRIIEWCQQQPVERLVLLEDVPHSLMPWLLDSRSNERYGENVPTFAALTEQLLVD